MTNGVLLNSTGSQPADDAIVKALADVQSKFPKPVLSAYVTGSHANGYAVSTSDVDLYLVFAENLDKNDEQLAATINKELENIVPALDIVFRGLPKLLEEGEVGIKNHFLHIYGEPIHLKVPEPKMEDYAYRGMHVAYMRMELTRKKKPYTWPLAFPNEASPYKGYDWRERIQIAGKSHASIKEIVVLTGWISTGLISWKGKTYVPTKKEVPALFKSILGGQIAEDFQIITDLCRNKFKYVIPEADSDSDRQELIDLLPKVLSIENYFLEQYQHFLIENLSNKNPIRARTSIIRLGEVVYPNNLSIEALRAFSPANESQEAALKKSTSFLEIYLPTT
jgi:predicted nucleotidyltransferase